MKRVSIYIENILNTAGTERAVINLANNLNHHGHNVELVSLYSNSGKPFFNISSNIIIKHMNLKLFDCLILRLFYSIYIFIKLFISVYNDDRIIIGTVHYLNVYISLIKFLKNSNKYIGCEHIDFYAATFLTKIFRRYSYPNLNSIVVLTQNDKINYETEYSLINCKIIPNEISFYPTKLPDYTIKHIIAIGRLTKQKGFDILIDDIKDILLNNPGWTLSIIGDGEMKNILLDKIKSYNLEKKIFLSPTTNEIQNKFLQASIYIMTSRYEGLPMVLLEAKACGLPIIAYDCPSGPKEIIIDGEDGFLIPLFFKDDLCNKLNVLINNVHLRKKMGLNAKKNALFYSSDNVYDLWLKLFNSF